jgi:hypothetical protein
MTSTADLCVRCCGDGHLPSCGMSALPDAQLVSDLDDFEDFDELVLASFEWDVAPQEAQGPVLVPHTGPSEDKCQDEGAAWEQRVTQAAADELPDWATGIAAGGGDSGDYCVRDRGDAGCAIADFAALRPGQDAMDSPGLADAMVSDLVKAVLGLPMPNPQPRLTGPLLREGSRGRGRDGRPRPRPSPSARARARP